MKSTFLRTIAGALLAICSATALSQTYPSQNPTYIPTARKAAATITASTGTYEFITNGTSALTIRVSGTRTSMTAAVQGTNDDSTWTTLQLIPVGGGAIATSITANGFWMVNSAGFTKVRLNVTAHTIGVGTGITVSMAGTNAPNATYVLNPQAISGPVGVIGTDGTSTLDCAADGSCESNLTRVAGAAIAQGNGTAATAIRVALPTDGTGVVGLIAGTANIGAVNPAAAATGGATAAHILSAATTNSNSIKGSAGTLYTVHALSTNAATAYLKFYNIATAPTCASDTVLLTYPIVQNVPLAVDMPVGAAFSAGIGICITAAAADSDNAAATTGITLSVTYK